jgi:hypothetical protein
MWPGLPLRRLLTAHIALTLHLHGPAHWSLDFVGGLATRQFRVTVCRGLRGVRRDLSILVVERGAFHLSFGGHFRTSGCCAGLASIAEEEEAGASEEQDADDTADDDSGDGAAGEPFVG